MPQKVITWCKSLIIQPTTCTVLIKQKRANLFLASKWGHQSYQNSELWFFALINDWIGFVLADAWAWLFFVTGKAANMILKPNKHYNTEL